MKYKLLILTMLFLFPIVSATCTLSLDQSNYSQQSTATVTANCDATNEKGKVYTITWTNSTGFEVEVDIGTTPSIASENFFETYIIPSNYVSLYGNVLNVNMTGTNLEGTISVSVNTGSSTDLIITNGTLSSNILLGKISSFSFILIDENNKEVNNAKCHATIEDGNNLPIAHIGEVVTTSNGHGTFSTTFSSTNFDENRQYIGHIKCICGVSGTTEECFDEDGTSVTKSYGSTQVPFTIGTWLTVNTVTDKTLYEVGERVNVCANVTSSSNESKELDILYTIRCDSGADSNTDRILIGEKTENRRIEANLNQMQCHDFIIPDIENIEKGADRCFGVTEVKILDKGGNLLVSYNTISPRFNLTVNEVHPNVKWRYVSRNVFFANVSIDDFDVGIRDIHNLISSHLTEFNTPITLIKSFSVKYMNGTAIPYSFGLQAHGESTKINGLVIIENRKYVTIFDVNTTLDENFNITIVFMDIANRTSSALENSAIYGNRSATALEGIENKTGTFHLEVNCPSFSYIGDTMVCSITAQIEDSQLVEKEVDFTCYVLKDGNKSSELNFNQMITRTPITIDKNFLLLDSLLDKTEYTLQCEAGYYNLGSRTDLFFDTFEARTKTGGLKIGGLNLEDIIRKIPIVDTIINKLDEKSNGKGFTILIILLIFFITSITWMFFIVAKKLKDK